MIEDKEKGIVIAESPEEAMWVKVRRAREMSIKTLEETLLIEKEIMKMAEEKLKKLESIKKKKS